MTRGRQEPAFDRFATKYIVLENGCWEWTAGINNRGYATFNPERDKVYAHRWIFEQLVGPIPEDKVLDHLCHTNDVACDDGEACRHRRCVNPLHLESVGRPENTRRSRPATKTHCVNGHEFTPENTWHRPGRPTTRCCRTCFSDRYQARKASKSLVTT